MPTLPGEPTPSVTPTEPELPTPSATATATPTALPPQTRYLFTFDPLGRTLESFGFNKVPASVETSITELTASSTYPQATNGVGLEVKPQKDQLVILNGPAIQIISNPVRISCWYRASHKDIQVAIGAFADINGQGGASVYTMRTVPEFTPKEWHKIEIEVNGNYTRIIPFMAMYDKAGNGTVDFDNLEILMGETAEQGAEIAVSDWQPNLWLNDDDKGLAYTNGGTMILLKDPTQKATRFVGSFEQTTTPFRASVDLDVKKVKGASGTLTIWIGNGPSAVQNDIPLWMIADGETRTLHLSGITTNTPGPVFIVLQTAGQDDERVEISNVHVSSYSNAALKE